MNATTTGIATGIGGGATTTTTAEGIGIGIGIGIGGTTIGIGGGIGIGIGIGGIADEPSPPFVMMRWQGVTDVGRAKVSNQQGALRRVGGRRGGAST